ncbi:MAG: DUF2878 domain-containing protein [Pseudomonadales bacterium]|nr:DUF2878 domain-containing protein [Pseudomonadales bacterium]
MSLMIQNFILFQVGWLSCVIGGASSVYHWVGVTVVAAIVAVHLLRSCTIINEIMLILITTLLGTTWDSVLMGAGLLAFNNGVVFDALVPFWMISMWVLFATTLNVSMQWMKNRYLLAIVFGAIGGPFAYYAGHRLGAIEFSHTTTALLIVGAGWAVIMPLLMYLSTRFNGYRKTDRSSFEVKTI